MPRTKKPILLVLSAILWLATSTFTAWAQPPAREELERIAPGTTPSTIEQPMEEEEEGIEEDLGPIIVLKRPAQYQPVRVYSDTQYLYNSNVLLIPSGRDEDAVFVESLGATYSPKLIPGMASTVFVRHQFVRYDELHRFDFDAQSAGFALQRPVRDWFILSGGFEAERFYSRRTDDEFLKDFNLTLGIRRGEYLHPRVFLYYGYQFNWTPTSPSDLSRLDNSLYAGVNVALAERLNLQLAYRARGLAYYQDSRFDFDHSLYGSVMYKFTDYLNVRAFVSYVRNDSDSAGHDYQGMTAGGGLGIDIRF